MVKSDKSQWLCLDFALFFTNQNALPVTTHFPKVWRVDMPCEVRRGGVLILGFQHRAAHSEVGMVQIVFFGSEPLLTPTGLVKKTGWVFDPRGSCKFSLPGPPWLKNSGARAADIGRATDLSNLLGCLGMSGWPSGLLWIGAVDGLMLL